MFPLYNKLKDDILLIKEVCEGCATRKFISTLFILFFIQIFFAILLDIYVKI